MLDRLNGDLKAAQLKKDEVKVSTLRLLLSEIKNTQIQKGEELSSGEIIQVVQREAKKRKEAAAGFRQGGREEQAGKEEAELKILEFYLPPQLSDGELTKVVEDTIKELGANSIKDLGRVISSVREKAGQNADGGRISALVRQRLFNQ